MSVAIVMPTAWAFVEGTDSDGSRGVLPMRLAVVTFEPPQRKHFVFLVEVQRLGEKFRKGEHHV